MVTKDGTRVYKLMQIQDNKLKIVFVSKRSIYTDCIYDVMNFLFCIISAVFFSSIWLMLRLFAISIN